MIGLSFNTVDGTTTTIVKRLITQAQDDMIHITGTTTGKTQDRAIRGIVCANVVRNTLANIDPNKDNMEAFIQMRDDFIKDANDALRLSGFSIDGIKMQFVQVNP